MSNHATLSPSKANRWIACPQSIRKIAALFGDKESPTSAAADDGTHTHYLLKNCLSLDKFELVEGKKYTSEVGEFTLDKDRIERVNFVLSYIESRLGELGPTAIIYSERNLPSRMMFGRDDMNGTADVVIVSDTVIEVIDLKDGMHPVKADGNWQMMIYLLLAMGAETSKIADNVRMTIVQPKLRVVGQAGIDFWEITKKEALSVYLPAIIEAARKTDDENAPLVPGEEQCRYCPAKGSCMALIEHSLAQGGVSFKALDLPEEIVTINAAELTNERLKALIMAIPLLQTMIGAAEEEALRRFQIGQPVDGLKVIRGRGSRDWNCDDETAAAKLRGMGIPKDVVYKTSIVTPTQAEKLKWTKRTGEEKKLTPRQIKALSDIINRKEGKLKVVSESVDGKAVDLAPLTFTPVIPEWMR